MSEDHNPKKFNPTYWDRIPEDEMSSTIANFRGGFKRKDESARILLWEGIEEDGEYSITPVESDEAPEWARYVIEMLGSDEHWVEREKFAETEVGAWTKIKRLIESQDSEYSIK